MIRPMDIRAVAAALATRVKCATCGKTPNTRSQASAYDDGWEFLFRCHGRTEEVFVSGLEMKLGRIPWSLILAPFWPGFSVCRAKSRPDVGRRQLWRERKASYQRARRTRRPIRNLTAIVKRLGFR